MEQIRTWAIALSMVIVLGTLLETLIPDGSFRKYIHVVIAVLLIISVISPWLRFDYDKLGISYRGAEEYSGDMSREELRYRQQKDVIDIYKKTLENNLKTQLVQIYPNLEDSLSVKITADESESGFGHITNAALIIESESGVDADELREKAAEMIGVSKDSVAVVM